MPALQLPYAALATLALTLAPLGHAALPPGYDEELYCPPGMCVRVKDGYYRSADGTTGPRSALHECWREDGGEVAEPAPWGTLVVNADEAKAALLAQGHTRWVCGEPEPRAPFFNLLGEDTEYPMSEVVVFVVIVFGSQFMAAIRLFFDALGFTEPASDDSSEETQAPEESAVKIDSAVEMLRIRVKYPPGAWACEGCGFRNAKSDVLSCEMCAAKRPPPRAVGEQGGESGEDKKGKKDKTGKTTLKVGGRKASKAKGL